MLFQIALDGPVGAGKSSVADGVAEKLHIVHLDTGAMYRAVAFCAMEQGISVEDEERVTRFCESNIPDVSFVDGKQKTLLNGRNVTKWIRTQEIGTAASKIATYSGVRKVMVKRQKEIAQKQSIIIDGRDIGTCVLTDATIKIFLTATPENRAQRRYEELRKKNFPAYYEEILAEVKKRDEQDTTRKVEPLRMADDALLLNTDHLTKEQTVDTIIRYLQMRTHRRLPREEKFSAMYSFLKGVLKIVKHSLLPFTVHHAEYATLDAPYIIVSNHNSLLDPIFLAEACDRYHIRFLGKHELVKTKIARWFFEKCLRMIAVDRGNSDFAAFRSCVKVLKEGHALGIFPEGTRYKEGIMQHAETGTAMIALMSKQPILPVFLSGKPGLFKRIHVLYAPPFWPQDVCDGAINNEACEKLMKHLEGIYRNLYEEARKNGIKCYKNFENS